MPTLDLCTVLDRALAITMPGTPEYDEIMDEMRKYGCRIPKVPDHGEVIEPGPFNVNIFLKVLSDSAGD